MITPTSPTLSPEQQTRIREDWLARLDTLMNLVERWAIDQDWSTRRIDKKLVDPELGSYRAPSLLMQEGVTRIILEPIARSAPGAEGVVDLYELPAYDDVSTLFYQNAQWQVCYPMPTDPVATRHKVVDLQPLTAEVIGRIFSALTKKNA